MKITGCYYLFFFNENCNQKTIDKYNKLKLDMKSVKYYFEPDSNDNLIKFNY